MGGGGSKPKGAKRSFHAEYDVSRELGSGAFSVVKLAVNKKSHVPTAVKIIQKTALSEEEMSSLKMEIDILGSLDHEHIIKLHETFDEGKELYIVTELVEGGELFDRIVSKTNYTEAEARDLVKTFLETMAYLHEQGIVHRDLKPENLLLCSNDDDSNIKVADFGFAKRISELANKEVACGTPGYVAPEILCGIKYGAEVDVWSIGVICYVLLAGYPPFYEDDQNKLFKKIKEGKYHFHDDYWANTSPEAMDLIRKMLCVSQKDRWTARQLLEHPWITMNTQALKSKDLTGTITTLRKFNARRRLKSAADAIILTNRIKRMISGGRKELSKVPMMTARSVILLEDASLVQVGGDDGEADGGKVPLPSLLEKDSTDGTPPELSSNGSGNS